MWTFEKINAADYLDTIIAWQERLPRWLRFLKEETDEAFKDRLLNSQCFMGFTDTPQVFVQGEQVSTDKIFEGHIFCAKRANVDLMVATVLYGKNYLFENQIADKIVAMANTKHPSLSYIMARAGFFSTGMMMIQNCDRHGNLFETEMMLSVRPGVT